MEFKGRKCKSQKPNHKPIQYAAYLCIMVSLRTMSPRTKLFPTKTLCTVIRDLCVSIILRHLYIYMVGQLMKFQAHSYASSGSNAREDRGHHRRRNGFPVPMQWFFSPKVAAQPRQSLCLCVCVCVCVCVSMCVCVCVCV